VTTRFRHLDYAPSAAIRDLGPAAVDDLLERGDLEAWQPLAAEIAADPWGATAELVLRLGDAHPMYGTSTLWRVWIESRREAGSAEESSTLAAARRRVGLTQGEVARRLDISQADVSKLERRSDVRLSTLQAYARALGATLRVTLQWAGSGAATALEMAGDQARRAGDQSPERPRPAGHLRRAGSKPGR
jgi:transcriptional regulator with XRE-family HTH domain